MTVTLCLSIALHAALFLAARSASDRPEAQPGLKPIRVDLLPFPAPPSSEPAAAQAQSTPRLTPPGVASAQAPPRIQPPARLTPSGPDAAASPAVVQHDERRVSLVPAPLASTAVDGNEFVVGPSSTGTPAETLGTLTEGVAEAADDPVRSSAPDNPVDRAQAAAPTTPADPGPAPMIQPLAGRWRYQVYYGDFSENKPVATLDYVMRVDAQGYQLQTEGQAQGLLALFYRGAFRQRSEGQLSPAGFVPERYEEQRGDRPVRRAQIDQRNRVVRFDSGQAVDLPAEAQDRLSLAAQLAWLSAHEPARMQVPFIEVTLIGVSSVRSIRFDITRDIVIETPQGPKQLTRLRAGEGQDSDPAGSLELWLSGDRSLMPYRIRIVDSRGRVLDQLLSAD